MQNIHNGAAYSNTVKGTIWIEQSLVFVKITLNTQVDQSLPNVIEGFNAELFLKLNPPFPTVKLKQFDGCITGDTVSLELNFILFKQIWTSKITEDEKTDDAFFFVDEGIKLPFFFKSWRHKHLLCRQGDKTVITDAITYRTPFILLDWIMYPLLYLQFLYRKPIYRSVFGVGVS